jgi:hypothetical protein
MTAQLRVEFHCHTRFSKDCLVDPAALVARCAAGGIDRVIVTDHNSTGGALEAQALDPERVIVGEEIMTQDGELLAAFVQETLPAGLPAAEAIARLRAQGAFISVSHPFDTGRSGHWRAEHLSQIAPLVDAIEIFNSRCLLPRMNKQAAEFARRFDLPGTVGSDAHSLMELGRATLLLPHFADSDGLRQVIRAGQPQTRRSSAVVRLISRYAVMYKTLIGRRA